ncbi:amidohydrolase [Cyathus striatus]|nr:amidohydrolase [Cyathus striatus]
MLTPLEDWWVGDIPPAYSQTCTGHQTNAPQAAIEEVLDKIDNGLRELSLNIHSHDILTDFMESHGFKVTRHYLGLDTAWKAEYTHGKGGRVLGINSEMDALDGLGHACGHNLIAISGVGVAIAVKAALQSQNVSGKVVLLGTPAEEAGGGKAILLERGGYKEMDACIMCHPGPGLPHSVSAGSSSAMQSIEVEYFGRSAHAGAAPWEGTNALDAAFLAYSNISVLRQQMKPDYRIHGVVNGRDWAPNVIPDYSQMRWLVRAPTYRELEAFVERVKNCFEAAALATSCSINMKIQTPYYDLNQNPVLAQDFADFVGSQYGLLATTAGTSASTDFGNVSYQLPSLHPLFAIPTEPRGGNHTPAFAKAAASKEAHVATILVTKGLALSGYHVLNDDSFFTKVTPGALHPFHQEP